MGRIFITGDTHGDYEISKLGMKNFSLGATLTQNDYVIICGDFGCIWSGERKDSYWLDWLASKSFTTLFVDGNHENFDLLDTYLIDEWNGGKTHLIRPNIRHLMRGQIFTFNDKTFFTMGGATSLDKNRRKPKVSWWPQEIPSILELEEGIQNLERHGQEVDYVITHCLPDTVCNFINHDHKTHDLLTNYLEHMVAQEVKFKKWFCGHYHMDEQLYDKYYICYNKIYELLPNDEVKVIK